MAAYNQSSKKGVLLMVEFSVRLDFLKELENALPRVAALFTQTLNPPHVITSDDIHVIESPYTDHFNNPKVKDHCIKLSGPTKQLPPMYFQPTGMHSKERTAIFGGIALYRASTDKSIVYAFFCTRIGRDWIYCLLVPKGLLFRYQRHINRVQKKMQSGMKPPVMEEGVLEKIVQSSVEFLINSEAVEKYKVRLKRGLLLGGPPGNGKTMACKWLQKLCRDNNISCSTVTSSELEMGFAQNQLTEVVSQSDVTFFDDIDLSFLSRGVGGDSRMACSFASALDGFGREKHMVRIFTTNEDVSAVDHAFKRPGRIDQWFNIGLPTKNLRLKLIKTWHSEIIEAVLPDDIATRTEGYSFAELEAIKSALVINNIFGKTDGWDLSRALKDFEAYKPNDLNNKPAGFAAEGNKPRRYISSDEGVPTQKTTIVRPNTPPLSQPRPLGF